MQNINRRQFIKGTFLGAAALALPARSWSQVAGANSDIRIAVIGFHGRGQDHISGYNGLPGVRLVALCDVDQDVLDSEAAKQRKLGKSIETYTDVRKLLENKNIDAVSIATPNHWHSLITIWACQHGKDVYCEKPVSHNVSEGRRSVQAARKYNRIVQTGTQCRSSFGIKEAVAWVNEGHIGKIVVARGLCYKRRPSIGKVSAPQNPPPSVDYDLWCGPAPKGPLLRAKLHYDWHWVWPTGNGDLGNQGIHQMDIARWFLGVNELSPRVFSVGGRFSYIDDGETPNTQFVFHDYHGAPLIFEVRGLPEKLGEKSMEKYKGGDVAVVIECEGGTVLVPNYTSAIALDKEGKQIARFAGASNHYENFLGAVRSRNPGDLHADILEGHLSSALCHTGNISYRLGKQASPGEIKEAIKGDRDAMATFDRMQEHLSKNDVDLNSSQATLGQFLKMNPKSERFTNSKAANKMLTREYRKPYIVPERV